MQQNPPPTPLSFEKIDIRKEDHIHLSILKKKISAQEQNFKMLPQNALYERPDTFQNQ